MIEFRNVSKSYKKGVRAVDDLTLTINDGEIFGFLGPNGAGKSTTIRMLTGILNMDEGQILQVHIADGEPVQNVPRSVKEEGHEILRLDDNGDGTFELYIKKVGD